MTDYIIQTKRSQCATGIIVGIVLLFIGIDLRFMHIIPGCAIKSESGLWTALVIFTVLGILFLKGSIKALLNPSVLLKTTSKGISLYSGGTSKVWEPQTKTWKTTRSKGDAKTIPWSRVYSIGEGVILEASKTQWEHCFTRSNSEGSTTIGKRKMIKKPCLQILADSEIKLNGFRMGHCSRA